jgi:hypothetical protein
LILFKASAGGGSSRKIATVQFGGAFGNGLDFRTAAISSALRMITPTGLPA